MTEPDRLTPSELASLLCSRVCHDIISPVGAINNGLELLEDGAADEEAMDLVRTSAVNASARLQFARIAFGAAGSAGVQIDTGDAHTVASAFMKGEKADFAWHGERALLPKNQVKLLLNLILIGNASIPRGGTLDCRFELGDDKPRFAVTATGPMMRVPQKFADYHEGRFGPEPIDAHSVQFYYTLVLAAESGMTVSIDWTDAAITYAAA
ncbi:MULTISPECIES: histidine phosphotransferase family protein [unclassified Roseitalea]|uniref:histidine phosphotransferase ChpT n=1 Tax=unclassified Roseitalea TaxID=2639107 RepID=UPI00273DF79E|nr:MULTISPECIES: histidine phosphotransferase family protein [unclassified Roseitalea]